MKTSFSHLSRKICLSMVPFFFLLIVFIDQIIHLFKNRGHIKYFRKFCDELSPSLSLYFRCAF